MSTNPIPRPCGGKGQQACPPVPCIDGEPKIYSLAEVLAHGAACYAKGLGDKAREIDSQQMSVQPVTDPHEDGYTSD